MSSTQSLSPQTRGALFVLAGAVCISFSPLFVRLEDAGPSTVAMYRLLWGGLSLLIVAVIRGQRLVPTKLMLPTMLLASLFFSGDLTSWHQSILYVGPGLATILTNFQVFFLALAGALFFKEHLSLRLKISIPLALAGLWLLLDVNPRALPPDVAYGLFFGITAAVFYTGYILALRRSQSITERLPAEANMAVISLISAVMVAIIASSHGESILVINLRSNLLLLLYGVGCQGLGWFLLSRGLPLLPASQAGLILLVQPALSFVWDVLFLGRPTSFAGYCGAILALAAICLGVVGRSTTPCQNSTEPVSSS